MTRRTQGQERALRVVCALARTGLSMLDEMAARNEETDDRPRLYLCALERWTRGEERGAVLGAALRDLAIERQLRLDGMAALMGRAMWRIADARADLMRNPGHVERHSRFVRDGFAMVLAPFAAQPLADAREQVARWFAHHSLAVESEAAAKAIDARLTQAKADKVTAETALGTLPGVRL